MALGPLPGDSRPLCPGLPVRPFGRNSADGALAAPKKDLTLTLKITDKASGLTLEARKAVAADSNAFDALRHTVALTYRTDAAARRW